MRTALAILAVCLLLVAGCNRRPTYSFSYSKAQVAQAQLLDDQERLRRLRGVKRVVATPRQDGSAEIEVEVTEGHDIEIQRTLTEMGYQRGIH